MSNHQNDMPTRKEYRLSRAGLLTEGYKGLLIVNGGGAAALLAFVQAVWKDDKALAHLALSGISFMVCGLFFAMLVPFLRFHHSWYAEREELDRDVSRKRTRVLLRIVYSACQYLSAIAFLTGSIYLTCRALLIH